MSIKSQKSLNDECSEIFERSYSVRSFSDDNLSCSDEEESLAQELIRKVSPAALATIRRAFTRSKPGERVAHIDRKVVEIMHQAAAEEGIEFPTSATSHHEKALWIKEDTLVDTVNEIFGSHKYSTHAHKLFSLLDPFFSGKVWWSDLLERVVQEGGSRGDSWEGVDEEQIGFKQMNHCKRETIVKLVSIEQLVSYCLVSISRGGAVGLYDGNLRCLDKYHIIDSGTSVRVKNCWVTDALYMADVKFLVFSCSNRSLLVFDVATLTHRLLYSITGLPNIPTCLSYEPSDSNFTSSALIFGDERGSITRITFQQPAIALFYKKHSDKVNYYFWTELSSLEHQAFCSLSRWRRVHARSVRRVRSHQRRIMLSCSHDNNASLVFTHINGKLKDYVIKFPRGVSCYHWVPSLQLVACGSGAGVRLAGAAGESAVLPSRGGAVVRGVAVLRARRVVLAYTADCVLDIWDLYEETHLQTIKLKFPFLGVLGRKSEFGAYCIHPGPPRQTADVEVQEDKPREYWKEQPPETDSEYVTWSRSEIYVTCNDYICIIPLERSPPAPPLAPPARLLEAKRPSIWEGEDTLSRDLKLISETEKTNTLPPETDITYTDGTQSVEKCKEIAKVKVDRGFEELLLKADLQGILDKNFIQMMSHKQDSNQKLAAMSLHFDKMRASVSVGAPYLALSLHEPDPLPYNHDMEGDYRKVLRLFPSSSSSSPASSSRSHKSSERPSKC